MISSPAIPYAATTSGRFTLNDLRMHSYASEEKSPDSGLTVSGIVLVATLAIGAFVMLDPLALFAPPEPKTAAPASVTATKPEGPTAIEGIITPQPIVPASKSIEEPSVAATVIQATHAPAPAARQRSGVTPPESRRNPKDKTNTTVLRANPAEKTAPPVLLIKPEEKAAPPVLLTMPEEKAAAPVLLIQPEVKTDAPVVLNRGDNIVDAPKPAAMNEQLPVKEEVK